MITPRLDVLVRAYQAYQYTVRLLRENAPFPIRESVTGELMVCANLRSSSAAPEVIAPPPTKMNGFSCLADQFCCLIQVRFQHLGSIRSDRCRLLISIFCNSCCHIFCHIYKYRTRSSALCNGKCTSGSQVQGHGYLLRSCCIW